MAGYRKLTICGTFLRQRLVEHLDAQRHTLTAAQTQRGQTRLQIALLQRIQQGDQHARTRAANGMAQRNRTAVDVDLGPVHRLLAVTLWKSYGLAGFRPLG